MILLRVHGNINFVRKNNSLESEQYRLVREPVIQAVDIAKATFPESLSPPAISAIRHAAYIAASRLLPETSEAEARARHEEAALLTDKLTGLDNRLGFQQNMKVAIELAERYSTSVHLVLLYFDNLKDINDLQGHSAGDDAILNAAQILQGQTMDTHPLRGPARFEGGDEFAVIHVGVDDTDITTWWNETKDDFARAGIIMGAGVASYNPTDDHRQDAGEHLLERAAQAQLSARYKGGVLENGGSITTRDD